MGNLTITNLRSTELQISDAEFKDMTLSLDGAQTVPRGRILAVDSVSLKAVQYRKGGAALKSTNDGPFNLTPGATLILDVNNVGNATATWDAASATITDTTVYPVADQDGLTMTVTLTGGLYDGELQTVTFSGATTTAAGVAAQMNAQLKGCSVSVVGGQVVITHDGAGTGMTIATGAGTGGLTWAAAVAGTGDVADIDAVTATEIKTVIEADTTATVEVVGDAAVIKATEELDVIGGTSLTALGLIVETITANDNGIAKMLMPYELEGANGDNSIRALIAGKVREDEMSTVDGATIDLTVTEQLRNYGIIALPVTNTSILDNQ